MNPPSACGRTVKIWRTARRGSEISDGSIGIGNVADVVIDTNILIDFSRGLARGAEFLVSLAERSLGISAMTRFEMIAGCRNKQELRKIERLVQRFEILKFNEPQRTSPPDYSLATPSVTG